MSARAISSSLRCPPESVPANSCCLSIETEVVEQSRPRVRARAASWRAPANARAAPRECARRLGRGAPRSMLSSTVMPASAFVSWNVRTMPCRAMRYAGQPAMLDAVERPAARVRLVEAGQQVEQRGLARAVRSDERGDRVARHLEVVDVDGEQATEACGRTSSTTRIGSGFGRWRAQSPIITSCDATRGSPAVGRSRAA